MSFSETLQQLLSSSRNRHSLVAEFNHSEHKNYWDEQRCIICKESFTLDHPREDEYPRLMKIFSSDVLCRENFELRTEEQVCPNCLTAVKRISELKQEADFIQEKITEIVQFLRDAINQKDLPDSNDAVYFVKEEVEEIDQVEEDGNLSPLIFYPGGDGDGDPPSEEDEDSKFDDEEYNSDPDFDPDEKHVQIRGPIATGKDPLSPDVRKTCSICFQIFGSIKDKILHKRIVHLNMPTFSCTNCGLHFTQESRLKKHLKVKQCLLIRSRMKPQVPPTPGNSSTPFRNDQTENKDRKTCSICSLSFSSIKEKILHKRIVHLGKPTFSCANCGLNFTQESRLKKHLKRLKCQNSGQRESEASKSSPNSDLNTMSPLIGHIPPENAADMDTDETEMPPQIPADVEFRKTCSICSLVFPTIKEKILHERIVHLDMPIFSCANCGLNFTQESRLRKHLKFKKKCNSSANTTETGRQELELPSPANSNPCKKSEIVAENVAKIDPVETGIETPGADARKTCSICGLVFPSIKEKILHKNVVHLDKPTFSCANCGLNFTQESRLKKHLKFSKCKIVLAC